MPGYLTKQESIAVAGVPNLIIRSLLDRQQFFDPAGEGARLGISSATWPLFGLLWPSGAELAARMARHPVRSGERVLEIGCGLALASLVGHRRGADVTASDCHPLAGIFLKENLRLNDLSDMRYRTGQWGQPEDDALAVPTSSLALKVSGQFDLIMGSDVLYERDDAGVLAAFIDAHAMPVSQIWIVDPHRGNRPAFSRRMASHGFSLVEERLDRLESAQQTAYRGRLLTYSRGACVVGT
ncbi:MAG: SAM-dependent methyltransferase [Rhodoferax sp.]|uniref:class I SAM-dependent methyltransferase n=1 Tax=Rhodoferax sp. TaxID=50421 RepID=UPI002605BF05|nr:SAM-dependent methyltransferase [Rhodoferax sp.]MDD2882386.1 SAM-dependent methyltransferase [Rhodoferax sp.]